MHHSQPAGHAVPPLKLHTQTGQFRAWLTKPNGQRGFIYFGTDPLEARERYRLAVDRFLQGTAPGPKVRDVVSTISSWATNEYPVSGRWGGEAKVIKYALTFLETSITITPHGQSPRTVSLMNLPAEDFSVMHLAAVQQQMIAKRKSRSYINSQIARIIRAWSQARVMGMVSAKCVEDLRNLRPIRQGHPTVHETGRVLSVDDATIALTLTDIDQRSPMVGTMIRVLRLTGMRVGELCPMRLEQLDTSAPVWMYDLGLKHKTAKRKHRKVIRLNPDVQQLMAPYIDAARKVMSTKACIWGSDLNPTGHLQSWSIRRAIDSACARLKITPAWTTHQLRHARATEIAKLEAQAIKRVREEIGHGSDSAARVYIDPGAIAG